MLNPFPLFCSVLFCVGFGYGTVVPSSPAGPCVCSDREVFLSQFCLVALLNCLLFCSYGSVLLLVVLPHCLWLLLCPVFVSPVIVLIDAQFWLVWLVELLLLLMPLPYCLNDCCCPVLFSILLPWYCSVLLPCFCFSQWLLPLFQILGFQWF
jgi:hypothetical protein